MRIIGLILSVMQLAVLPNYIYAQMRSRSLDELKLLTLKELHTEAVVVCALIVFNRSEAMSDSPKPEDFEAYNKVSRDLSTEQTILLGLRLGIARHVKELKLYDPEGYKREIGQQEEKVRKLEKQHKELQNPYEILYRQKGGLMEMNRLRPYLERILLVAREKNRGRFPQWKEPIEKASYGTNKNQCH